MKEQKYQDILVKAALSRRNKVNVSVRIKPEHENPVEAGTKTGPWDNEVIA